jgi:pimeloyl-ACP methyl ester carboxylesterase
MQALDLPDGIRTRYVDNGNGLHMHVLEAGAPGRPCVLLLHGFPELAYSWRHVMPKLADAGYHVVAPDQRGYGRTTGWDAAYDGDLASFRMLNLVRDVVGLVTALGVEHVAVIGHDFGSPVAAWCALIRPDVFRAVALMSAPFSGAPGFSTAADGADIHAALAHLPRPRKHYQWYYSTREADADMRACAQGLPAFLRAYYHMKSADWPSNAPYPLQSWTASELAEMPTYYIMDLHETMAQTVAPHMPRTACAWLTDAELAVYAEEYARTGFQGGLQWYRCNTSGANTAELRLFAGRTIDVPAIFIAGASDWGVYQFPAAFEQMQSRACTDMRSCYLIEGAGHWVQQEQPEKTAVLLLGFLSEAFRPR